MSPLLFNIYSEKKNASKLMVLGSITYAMRYNTLLIASNLYGLQELLDEFRMRVRNMTRLNIKKTKCMIILKQPTTERGIQVDGLKLEYTNKIKYLRYTLKDDWNQSLEIRSRIEQARAASICLRKTSQILLNVTYPFYECWGSC